MAFGITSNYAGKAAGFYVNAALNEAKSLEFMTKIENIKYKSNIQKYAGGSLIVDAGCGFSTGGNLTGTEAVLEPSNLMINLQICKNEFLDSFEALQMRAGAGANPPASFEDYVMSYIGEFIADGVEGMVWAGSGTNACLGFNYASTGILNANPDVDDLDNPGGAGVAYDTDDILTALGNTLDGVSTSVYNKEDLHLYISTGTWRLYVQKLASLSSVPFANMNDDWTKQFNGVKLAVCPGMLDDQIVAARSSNMFFGTDLLSDMTRIQILDMSNVDGSDELRLVARFSAGVQTAFGGDVVYMQ
ncbi:MAG: hypothetical protein Unbinned3065contig1007_40 [Prokaryotic dsDNA virus sp.]|nr:MAG: hypothetical protein Unbinned3065contig1007_40 [Prokaryotic dsDNA virus sp.]|tara:strand:- start:486 stop:1394 length:909 start_codon:yes stop_codon:yes gene_type:complete